MSHLKRKELKWHDHAGIHSSIRSEATKIPNQENFTDNYVLKWDDALGYLVDSNISDDGDDISISANINMVGNHYLDMSDNEIMNVNYINFNLSFADGTAEGRLQWNMDDGTLEFGMPGGVVVQQIGQESLIRCKNTSGDTMANGTVVYIDSAVGSVPTIDLADPDSVTTSSVIGITTEEILNNAIGYVNAFGLVRGLDTSGCNAGDIIWLGEDGAWSNVRPTSPKFQVGVGVCLYSHATEGNIFCTIDIIPRLQELSDTYMPSLNDNDIVRWVSANSRFEVIDGVSAENLTDNYLTYYDQAGINDLADAPMTTDGTDLTLLGDLKTDRWLNSDTNTFIGVDVAGAGNLAHTAGNEGWYNLGLGYQCLYSLRKGYRNMGVGYAVLYNTLDGYKNFGVGDATLFSNIDGYENFAFGFRAGYLNTSGYRNFWAGNLAGYENTVGYGNTALGNESGYYNQTGTYNTFGGYESGKGQSGNSHTQNAGFGAYSLRAVTTGSYDSFFGYNCGYSLTSGNHNAGYGTDALYTLTTAVRCSAFGRYALYTCNGNHNSGFGYQSLYAVSSGVGNLGLGYQAGNTLTTADYCILIGYNVQGADNTTDYQLNIGDAILGNLSTGDIDVTGDLTAKGCKFGDGGITDYTEIEADGTIVFNGAAVVWDDIRVPLSSIKRLGFTDPDWVKFADDGAGSTGVYALAFDDTADEEVFFSCQIPHSYKEETDIIPHVHWAPSDGDAGNVTWKLEYTWQNIDGTFGNTSTVSVTDSTDSTSHKHLYAEMSAITGTSKIISSELMCRLYRDVSDGDTYGSDAFLLEFDFHFEKDTVGSRLALTK